MSGRTRVTILGAGPAGLATAFRLTDPDASEHHEVTVMQLGWRAGGQCQSGRVPPHWWVNQNGTHYLFGCYDEAIHLLKRAYDVLEEHGDARFGTFREQLVERSLVVLQQQWQGRWTSWEIHFPTNDRPVGAPHEVERGLTPSVFRQYVDTVLGHVAQRLTPALDAHAKENPLAAAALEARNFSVRAIAASIEEAQRLLEREFVGQGVISWAIRHALALALRALRAAIGAVLGPLAVVDLTCCRLWIMADLGLTIAIGILVDDALGPQLVEALDDYDLREWLLRHGVCPSHAYSPPIETWYDSMASFERGAFDKPICAAGPSLSCLFSMVLNYKGAVAWQLLNEVGDSVIGPIFAALQHRGVRFEFFHRVWELVPEGDRIGRVVLERQAELASANTASYQPFIAPVDDRPVWPDSPVGDQLAKVYVDLEHPDLPAKARALDNFWCPRSGPTVELKYGDDYDVLVCAMSGAALRWYLAPLAARTPAWRERFEHIRHVETEGLRIWFLPKLLDTGWTLGPPITSAYALPFATWEDPSPVLASQSWPPDNQPQCISHLFGPLPFPDPWPDPQDWSEGNAYLDRQQLRADEQGKQWMSTQVGALWPNCTQPDNPAALDLRYCAREPQIRANSGPNEAYLQLIPGTYQYRIEPDQTDYAAFFAVGDWNRTWFPCGSVEAAISSGLLAGSMIVAETWTLGATA